MKVRIRENFKKVSKSNKLSGHSWTEHGETMSYSVITPAGCAHGPYKKLEKAEKVMLEFQEFYDKHFAEHRENNHDISRTNETR